MNNKNDRPEEMWMSEEVFEKMVKICFEKALKRPLQPEDEDWVNRDIARLKKDFELEF